MLDYAQQSSEEGLYFSSNVEFSWEDAGITTTADANFSNDNVTAAQNGVTRNEGRRSQQAYLVALGPADMLNVQKAVIHPVCWEAQSLEECVERP